MLDRVPPLHGVTVREHTVFPDDDNGIILTEEAVPSCSILSKVSEVPGHNPVPQERVRSYGQFLSHSEHGSSVPGRRKSSRASLSWSSFCYAILLFCSFVTLSYCDQQHDASLRRIARNADSNSTAASAEDYGFACKEVQYLYQAMSRTKGFPLPIAEIPNRAISGTHLQICSGDLTCCTESMEKQLAKQSEQDFGRLVQDQLVMLRHALESSTSKFDRFFRELLERARTDLHSMFTKTYGLLYQKEAALFSRLFQNLTSYYAAGTVDLGTALDSFYTELYRRMFKILNEHMSLPPSTEDPYWQCVQGLMNRLRPFGDVPDRMKEQVIRSFVASRTFVRGLAAGRDIVHRIMEMQLEDGECSKWLMKMNYCGHCGGFPGLKPCHKFCNKVVNGCLASLAHLKAPWKEYVDAMQSLLTRLEGPFNIESVIEPIDVEISNAIMTFQENGAHISEKVFEACKRPSGGAQSFGALRSKRAARHTKQDLGDLQFGWERGKQDQLSTKTTASGTNLEKLAFDIKRKLSSMPQYWSNLAPALCDRNLAAPANKEYDCWNGMDKNRFEPDAEVAVNDTEPNATVRDQILALRHITRHIMQAYEGKHPAQSGQVKIDEIKTELRSEYPTDDEDFAFGLDGSGSGEPPETESGTGWDKFDLPRLYPKHRKPDIVLDKPHVEMPVVTTTAKPVTTTVPVRTPVTVRTTVRPKYTYPFETDDEDLVGGSGGSGDGPEPSQEEGSGRGEVPMVIDWPPRQTQFERKYPINNNDDFATDFDLRNPHSAIGKHEPYHPPVDHFVTPRPRGYDDTDFVVGVRTEKPPPRHVYPPPPQSMGAISNLQSSVFVFASVLSVIWHFRILLSPFR